MMRHVRTWDASRGEVGGKHVDRGMRRLLVVEAERVGRERVEVSEVALVAVRRPTLHPHLLAVGRLREERAAVAVLCGVSYSARKRRRT